MTTKPVSEDIRISRAVEANIRGEKNRWVVAANAWRIKGTDGTQRLADALGVTGQQVRRLAGAADTYYQLCMMWRRMPPVQVYLHPRFLRQRLSYEHFYEVGVCLRAYDLTPAEVFSQLTTAYENNTSAKVMRGMIDLEHYPHGHTVVNLSAAQVRTLRQWLHILAGPDQPEDIRLASANLLEFLE